jgi:hypothetical protein
VSATDVPYWYQHERPVSDAPVPPPSSDGASVFWACDVANSWLPMALLLIFRH